MDNMAMVATTSAASNTAEAARAGGSEVREASKGRIPSTSGEDHPRMEPAKGTMSTTTVGIGLNNVDWKPMFLHT